LRASGLVQRALLSLGEEGHVRVQAASGQRFYSVVEERRMALDYHKNSILHFLVAPSIVAMALRSFAGQAAPVAELMRRARDLSRMFKHDFVYEPTRTLEDAVAETLQLLVRWGIVERSGDSVLPVVAGVWMGQLLADLLRPFGEGAWIASDSLQLLLPGPMPAKEWAQKALERGRAAWLAGRVRRLESLSKATLENAVLALRDRGVVRGAKLELAPEWREQDKIASIANEAGQYVN
jgi:glycerol-3-phosphate O-acyltransferase